jgi:hypothetical protein
LVAARYEQHSRPSARHRRAAARRRRAVKVTRSKSIRVPDGICLQCFNSQQRFTFPFLIYCEHAELLALVHSADDNVTFHCKPEQLAGVIAKLSSLKGAPDAVSPPRDRL